MPQPTDAPAELAAFCRREYGRVFGALVLYTGEPRLAEELTQEAFVRVCRDWSKVARMAAPGAWVHRVAMNLAKSRFRRRGARRRAEARLQSGMTGASLSATSDNPGGGGRGSTEGWAERETMRAAVAALPAEERAVIVLRFYADLSVTDTAAALRIPDGTVKTRTRRALARLADAGLTGDELMEVTP